MFKKSLLPLLLFILTPLIFSAQTRITQVFGPDYYENFNDADIAAGGNGWAVGDCGLYLQTTDGGASWTDVSDRFDDESDRISCLPGTNCQTVFRTSRQGLFASFNGGQSWRKVIETGLFGEFDYSLPGTIFTWQDRQKDIATSTDGGQSWTVINTSIARIQTRLVITSATEYGFFESSRFYRTTDGGQTFSQGEAILDRPASLATNTANGDYYAVDRSTKLWRSTDKGVNWTLHNQRIFQYTVHNGLWTDNNDALHYTTFLGIHVVSTDGGLNWERVSNGPRLWSARRYKQTETGHLAIGNGNSLHAYDPTENTYDYLLGEEHPNFITMGFSPDGATGYASSRDGLLYKSTNGGRDWFFTNTTIPGDPISIIARSATDILYLGENSRLMESSDGGATFTSIPLSDPLTSFSDGALFPAGNNEYFIMDVNSFGRIKADGEVIFANNVPAGGTNLYFLDDDNGFRFGRLSLLRTTDGGRTWTEPTVDGTISSLTYDMHFVDNDYGVLLGAQSLETQDGGATWSPLDDFPRGNHFATNASGDTVYIHVNGEIQQSPNRQSFSWETIADLDCGFASEILRRPGSNDLIALETSGIALIEPHIRETPTGVWSAPVVNKLRLFPNPTDGVVQLDLPSNLSREAVAEVFAANGQLLKRTLLASSGTQLDLSGSAPGLHLVRVADQGKVWSGRVVVR